MWLRGEEKRVLNVFLCVEVFPYLNEGVVCFALYKAKISKLSYDYNLNFWHLFYYIKLNMP